MNPQEIQQLLAQYLRSQGGQGDPQVMAQQQAMQQMQAMPQMQIGGFMQPQMPSGGMGSMQGQMAPQQGIIRGR